ncbi:MAG: tRNA lysidine(34) synthetase TilS [Panacagrimonas sp.]
MSDSLPIPDIALPRHGRLWVGFSGGLDSTALLHALAHDPRFEPTAVHVHHGLQAVAADWAAHCQRICTGLGADFRLCRVDVVDQGQGIEAAARDARYTALRACMASGDVLATAHHQDDQAETVLLRLLRGTGPAGLAAMRPLTGFTPGWLWRPLLAVPRSRIEAYARAQGLRWIEDPHNGDSRFARSLLRKEILPRLTEHWPGASRNLARAADLSAETAQLLSELAASDLADIVEPGGSLPVAALGKLPPARRRNLLRAWVAGLGLPAPFHDTLLRLDGEVLDAGQDANPLLSWPGGEFRRHRDRLFALLPLPPRQAEFCIEWDGHGEQLLPPGCGMLQVRSAERPVGPCVVRLARTGERFRPSGSRNSRTLKNLFQELGIPIWVRERTPVIERDGAKLWVGGIGWASDFDGAEAPPDILWLHRPPGGRADGSAR